MDSNPQNVCVLGILSVFCIKCGFNMFFGYVQESTTEEIRTFIDKLAQTAFFVCAIYGADAVKGMTGSMNKRQ